MQCQFVNHQPIDLSCESSNDQFEVASFETTAKPVYFQTHFEGYMEMYSNAETVAEYLNAHEGWFCRCAHPMRVEPIGNNGYTLVVGKFGSRGYEVEPKIAVVLHPPQKGIYLMNSIPIPGYQPPGYEVDYQSSLELLEIPTKSSHQSEKFQIPPVVTRVKWELHLKVAVKFPKFIYKLPLSIIQGTGDHLLAQIIRQISPCLTYKVQKDFHSRLNLPIPSKSSRHLQKI